MTIYAIGDIHGQLSMLQEALGWIEADGGPDAQVVFLGDYVDRGPDSAGVLELISGGINAGRNWTAVKGNHDRMFEWFLEDGPRHDPHLKVTHNWLHKDLGGRATLSSYGIEVTDEHRLSEVHAHAKEAVPAAHKAFLRNLPCFYQTEGYLFVHAGIRPKVALADQEENDLVWIREPFLSFQEDHPWLVVHGHTALKAPQHYGNRVNLDSGAGYGRPISVGVFEGDDVYWLQNGTRVAAN
ncbi:metallophosphoesterase family protein [Tritonibacter aquimaris]